MPLGREARARLEDTQTQIARLRTQVEQLAKDYGSSVSDAASRAGNALTEATGITREQAKAAVGSITLTQISLIIVAAVIGWAVGRTTR